MERHLTDLKRLRENIIEARLSHLYREMKEDKELDKLLHMTAKEFEDSKDRRLIRYIYLIEEVSDYPDYTLLDLIEASCKHLLIGLKLAIFTFCGL
jgi:hypothetical protein